MVLYTSNQFRQNRSKLTFRQTQGSNLHHHHHNNKRRRKCSILPILVVPIVLLQLGLMLLSQSQLIMWSSFKRKTASTSSYYQDHQYNDKNSDGYRDDSSSSSSSKNNHRPLANETMPSFVETMEDNTFVEGPSLNMSAISEEESSVEDLPSIVWLMAFPDSGSSYIMSTVEEMTGYTVATNYFRGNATAYFNDKNNSELKRFQLGPFIKPDLPLPPVSLLTKTHCEHPNMQKQQLEEFQQLLVPPRHENVTEPERETTTTTPIEQQDKDLNDDQFQVDCTLGIVPDQFEEAEENIDDDAFFVKQKRNRTKLLQLRYGEEPVKPKTKPIKPKKPKKPKPTKAKKTRCLPGMMRHPDGHCYETPNITTAVLMGNFTIVTLTGKTTKHSVKSTITNATVSGNIMILAKEGTVIDATLSGSLNNGTFEASFTNAFLRVNLTNATLTGNITNVTLTSNVTKASLKGHVNISKIMPIKIKPPPVIVVREAIHLIRNPFDHVMERLHHAIQRDMKQHERKRERLSRQRQQYEESLVVVDPADVENDVEDKEEESDEFTQQDFQEFCERRELQRQRRLHKLRLQEAGIRALLRPDDPPMDTTTTVAKDALPNVPCYSEWERLVKWHNHVIEYTRQKKIAAHAFYYESFSEDLDGTLQEILRVLHLPAKAPPKPFVEGNRTYPNFYTPEQMQAAAEYVYSLATPECWELIQHYFTTFSVTDKLMELAGLEESEPE